MALTQAWDFLIGAPEVVTKSLSVKLMARCVVQAATAVHSVYEIFGGKLDLSPQDIGQRAIGTFEVMVGDKAKYLKWCHVDQSTGVFGRDIEWGWSASAKTEDPSVTEARASSLEALTEKLFSPEQDGNS